MTNVGVSVSWYNANAGLITWTFINYTAEQKTVILLRNGYYYGDAFFSVYLNNNMTWFTGTLMPLGNSGKVPVGIVNFGGDKRIVAFLFTLAPLQVWSVIEGGFWNSLPYSYSVWEVSYVRTGKYCVKYDPAQVEQWDKQTNTKMTGYQPNPSVFESVEVYAGAAPYVKFWSGDEITVGECQQSTPPPKDDKKKSFFDIIIDFLRGLFGGL